MEEKIQELYFHLKTLKSALNTLEEILEKPFSLIVRDATIQRFEYTFELAWKLFRKAAIIEGIEVGSPRQAIRAMRDVGLLDDIDVWFEMMNDRNRTSHTYSATTAEQVFESARNLPSKLRAAMNAIEHHYLNSTQE